MFKIKNFKSEINFAVTAIKKTYSQIEKLHKFLDSKKFSKFRKAHCSCN